MPLAAPVLTPQQAISLVILNSSVNQMSSGIAEAESFALPECATALKLARDYLTKDRDRCLAMWAAEKKVAEAVEP